MRLHIPTVATLALCAACVKNPAPDVTTTPTASASASTTTTSPSSGTPMSSDVAARLARYTTVRLTTNVDALTPRERQMLPVLIDAARHMDEIYWMEVTGQPKEATLASITDPGLRRLAEINYGPWDRLDEDKPFLPGVGAKPPGAAYYPADMTKAEFEAAVAASADGGKALKSEYTLVRRQGGGLVAVPFHEAYAMHVRAAAAKLREAAALADDPGLRNYLTLRATALETDDYQPSDLAWMDMKNNTIDIVVGPIETYEDNLYGYKTAHESYVLVKDQEWSKRLARYVGMLPALQRGLPVREELKRETPGTGSDLNAYDAVFYAGSANAGAKTIAINLPNDEEVQLKKGTRRLQLKNAMRAKFDKILVPIADELITKDQRANITFDAFFENTMFHEVAHGLGIKNVITGTGTVRAALKEKAGGLEEEKADVLGLYMVTQLNKQGELGKEALLDNYVTFLAGLFRSVRFGANDAHGIANMATFNFMQDMGAFSRDPDGTWRVHFAEMQKAVDALGGKILELQGTGDYAGVTEFMRTKGVILPALESDLARLGSKGIPIDIVFEQGSDVIGAK